MNRPQTAPLFPASEGTSTPSPLPHKRSKALSREAAARTSSRLAQAPQKGNVHGSGLAPTNPIEKNDIAPLSRDDKAIETKECDPTSRVAMIARVEMARDLVKQLVTDLGNAGDMELLDIMSDDHATHSRFQGAKASREWISSAGVQLEIGFMMFDRVLLRPGSF
jgi:hypothetical protein